MEDFAFEIEDSLNDSDDDLFLIKATESPVKPKIEKRPPSPVVNRRRKRPSRVNLLAAVDLEELGFAKEEEKPINVSDSIPEIRNESPVETKKPVIETKVTFVDHLDDLEPVEPEKTEPVKIDQNLEQKYITLPEDIPESNKSEDSVTLESQKKSEKKKPTDPIEKFADNVLEYLDVMVKGVSNEFTTELTMCMDEATNLSRLIADFGKDLDKEVHSIVSDGVKACLVNPELDLSFAHDFRELQLPSKLQNSEENSVDFDRLKLDIYSAKSSFYTSLNHVLLQLRDLRIPCSPDEYDERSQLQLIERMFMCETARMILENSGTLIDKKFKQFDSKKLKLREHRVLGSDLQESSRLRSLESLITEMKDKNVRTVHSRVNSFTKNVKERSDSISMSMFELSTRMDTISRCLSEVKRKSRRENQNSNCDFSKSSIVSEVKARIEGIEKLRQKRRMHFVTSIY